METGPKRGVRGFGRKTAAGAGERVGHPPELPRASAPESQWDPLTRPAVGLNDSLCDATATGALSSLPRRRTRLRAAWGGLWDRPGGYRSTLKCGKRWGAPTEGRGMSWKRGTGPSRLGRKWILHGPVPRLLEPLLAWLVHEVAHRVPPVRGSLVPGRLPRVQGRSGLLHVGGRRRGPVVALFAPRAPRAVPSSAESPEQVLAGPHLRHSVWGSSRARLTPPLAGPGRATVKPEMRPYGRPCPPRLPARSEANGAAELEGLTCASVTVRGEVR